MWAHFLHLCAEDKPISVLSLGPHTKDWRQSSWIVRMQRTSIPSTFTRRRMEVILNVSILRQVKAAVSDMHVSRMKWF